MKDELEFGQSLDGGEPLKSKSGAVRAVKLNGNAATAFLRDPIGYDENRDYSTIKKPEIPEGGHRKFRYNKNLDKYEPSFWRKFDDEDAISGSSIDSTQLNSCCNPCTIL
jgi:hypothetical protein